MSVNIPVMLKCMYIMADNANNRGIKDSWPLLDFARMHGLPKPNHGVNKATGEEFDNLAFGDKEQGYTFVSFSSNLGVLSPEEILERKKDLQVVQLNPDENGKMGYLLCKAGTLNLGEEIDLFAD